MMTSVNAADRRRPPRSSLGGSDLEVWDPELEGGADAHLAEVPRGVRVVEGARADGAVVVEVHAPRTHNPLVRVYRALSTIGVRLVHTEVHVNAHTVVQRLHLLEPDDSPLSPRRLWTALAALAAVCQPVAMASMVSS